MIDFFCSSLIAFFVFTQKRNIWAKCVNKYTIFTMLEFYEFIFEFLALVMLCLIHMFFYCYVELLSSFSNNIIIYVCPWQQKLIKMEMIILICRYLYKKIHQFIYFLCNYCKWIGFKKRPGLLPLSSFFSLWQISTKMCVYTIYKKRSGL